MSSGNMFQTFKKVFIRQTLITHLVSGWGGWDLRIERNKNTKLDIPLDRCIEYEKHN